MKTTLKKRIKLRIRRDDIVKVISGKDKGKTGKVLRVFPETGKIIVEHVNYVKKHQRPNQQFKEGGIIEREAPIRMDKVMLVCPNCGQPTRVVRKYIESEKKHIRFCKKCGELIDKI